ncbi:hypothetical protein FRC17_009493 [Serendipita sp. 399]|nr:hypothetical protein FRC17_009493 [Serendipita sp. 399]
MASSTTQSGSTSLGIPIRMPTDRAVSPQRTLSNAGGFRRQPTTSSTSSTSSQPRLQPVQQQQTRVHDSNAASPVTTTTTPSTPIVSNAEDEGKGGRLVHAATTGRFLDVKRPNRRRALGGVSAGASTTSVNKVSGRNTGSGASQSAQVVLLKRKRNQEPLEGLLLETGSRYPSEHDLARGGRSGEEEEEEEGEGQVTEEKDVQRTGSVRARKRKRIASARGFFQLAETVEKAKWDDEAWRRDFNERVLTKSKEGKKALAAAAGVEVALDSPVIEKTQPGSMTITTTTGSSSLGPGPMPMSPPPVPPTPRDHSHSPLTSTGAVGIGRPTRKYTAVLQTRPSIGPVDAKGDPSATAAAAAIVKGTRAQEDTATRATAATGAGGGVGVEEEKGRKRKAKAGGEDPAGGAPTFGVTRAGPAEGNVLYFDAVPYGSSEGDGASSDSTKREEDEIAAFLPMLQDYLKLHDLAPTNVTRDVKPTKVSRKGGETVHHHQRNQSAVKEDEDEDEDDDEYVYDVYFKRSHEPTSSDWNNLGNYGTLIGLPPEMREDEDDSDGGMEDDSDLDIDDDSNDEGFYRNDYPDEEDDYSEEEESDEFYDDGDDSEEEEDYDDERRWY